MLQVHKKQKQKVESVTKQDSLVAMKNLIKVGVSSILHSRRIFNANDYQDCQLEGLSNGVKILSRDAQNERNSAVYDWVDACFKAIEKRYFHSMHLYVKTDMDGVFDKPREQYSFVVDYSDTSEFCESDAGDKDQTRKQVKTLFRKLNSLFKGLDDIGQSRRRITMEIELNEGVPEDYLPAAFRQSCRTTYRSETPAERDQEPRLKIGEVSTSHHRMNLIVKLKESLVKFLDEIDQGANDDPGPFAELTPWPVNSTNQENDDKNRVQRTNQFNPTDSESEMEIIDLHNESGGPHVMSPPISYMPSKPKTNFNKRELISSSIANSKKTGSKPPAVTNTCIKNNASTILKEKKRSHANTTNGKKAIQESFRCACKIDGKFKFNPETSSCDICDKSFHMHCFGIFQRNMPSYKLPKYCYQCLLSTKNNIADRDEQWHGFFGLTHEQARELTMLRRAVFRLHQRLFNRRKVSQRLEPIPRKGLEVTIRNAGIEKEDVDLVIRRLLFRRVIRHNENMHEGGYKLNTDKFEPNEFEDLTKELVDAVYDTLPEDIR